MSQQHTWEDRHTRDASRCLGELVGRAWESGWEPADLHGYVHKHWDAVTVKVLRDAVAADLDRYAAATVDPRWHDQLEEMSATVWWPPHTDHLTARAARESGGRPAVTAAYDILTLALVRLPTIERLGPPPGTAHPQRTPSTADERLLTRVRMMLAQAESTPYEAEAEAFTAAAHSLMARHSIDRALLDAAVQERSTAGPRLARVHTPAPYARGKFTLLSAVARASRCTAIWQEHYGFASVVGFDVDLRAVELLFASLLVQAQVGMRSAHPEYAGVATSGATTVFRRSFLSGFTQRIAERLAEVTRQETEAARAEHRLDGGAEAAAESQDTDRPGPPGTDVVQVLARRDAEVAASVQQRFPDLQTMRSRATLDPEGWYSGRAAGDRASLGANRALRDTS